jgi:xylulokinase
VVINGGQDHSCEALALGITSAGTGLLACGTAWVINAVSESPDMDAIPASTDLNYHVLPGRWVVSQFLGGLGACLEWWVSQSGRQASQTRDELWATFNAAMEKTTPGCGGLVYLPQTGVRQVTGSARHGGFVGLRLDHSWADMGRAMLEGAAYEVKWALEHLRGAGLAVEQMWMIGGAAQNPIWPQIVADITGVSVHLSPYSHGPALGAAMLAGIGLGIFDSAEEAQARFRVSAHNIESRHTHLSVYDQQSAAYRRLARVLVQ